ncbi:MAG: GntR family transcriptional regulator [Candidatus Krumholzibacteria bacterium]|nr:GntR family transcriptional regulator [Candidatus Krumholzibacteria bacterium]
MESPTLPLIRSSLREQVYDILREQLDNGELEPGSVIRQDDIARKLGVSRTPMREALLRLELEGFVVIKPRSGIRVRRLTEQDIRNLYQMIGALEASVLVTESAALTDEKIARMRRHNDEGRAALALNDFDRYYNANLALHDSYLKLSGNGELVHAVTAMKQRLYDFPRKRTFIKAWELASVDEHEDIISHLEAGDFARAAEVVRETHWSFEVQKDFIRSYYMDELGAEDGA